MGKWDNSGDIEGGKSEGNVGSGERNGKSFSSGNGSGDESIQGT